MRRYFSVIVGDGCNAACPFCIAPERMKDATEPFPVDRAVEAARWAAAQGATVASVSGGGEPLMLAARSPETFQSLTDALADLFPKRDLHSNYAVPAGIRRARLYPGYTDLTVSLWPDAATNRAYMRNAAFDRTVAALRAERDAGATRALRLSAVLGTDWARSVTDIEGYVQFAASLGASAITLRPMVTATTADGQDPAWITARRLDGATVERWLDAAGHPRVATTVRDAAVFDVSGVKVCCYRYAAETGEPDTDFWFFRPSVSTGKYGLFTDYADDSTAVAPLVQVAA